MREELLARDAFPVPGVRWRLADGPLGVGAPCSPMSSSERSGVACDGLHAPSPGSIPSFGAQLRGLTRAF
eukprot:2854769-Prymnesium_polylepis.1